MAYRAGVVGASGYTGAELLRLLAGHPEIEVVHVTADSQRGRGGRRAVPGPARRPTATCASRRSTPPTSRGLDLVFCALPHGASQALLPGPARPRRPRRSTSAPTSGCPPDVYARWYGEPHRAPEVVDRFAYGLVELYRDELATHAHVASPGCYPTAVSLACAPLLALELVEPRIIADAVSGVSGAGRGLKTTSLFSEANENVVGVRAADAPPHRGDGTGAHEGRAASRCTCCSRRTSSRRRAASSPRVTRGPATTGLSTARLLEHYREFYAERSVRRRGRRAVGHEGDLRRQRRARHRALRRAHRHRVAIAAEDNLVKGASGSDDPSRQPPARPARDDRPAARRDPAVSITAAPGFVAGGLACGIKESGAPDLALVATDDRAPVAAAARVHDEPRAGRAGADLAAPPRRRPRRRGRAQLRQRERGDRRAGPARRAAACASSTAEGLGARDRRRARVLDRAHRHPDADGRARSGHPEAVRHAPAEGGGDAARAMMTTDTVAKEAVAPAVAAGSMLRVRRPPRPMCAVICLKGWFKSPGRAAVPDQQIPSIGCSIKWRAE